MLNKNRKQLGRSIDYRSTLYGYRRVNKQHGADYVLDLLLQYKTLRGQPKISVPVRRHVYLQQPFHDIEFITDSDLHWLTTLDISMLSNSPNQHKGLHDIKAYLSGDVSRTAHPPTHTKRVNFILSLAGRYSSFVQFMHNFESMFLATDEDVALTVLVHQDHSVDLSDVSSFLADLQQKYPGHRLTYIYRDESFSRAAALQEGSDLHNSSDLLFFIDVDIYLRKDALHRIRLNTVQHSQVYYPIVFNQYNPITACQSYNSSCSNLHHLFSYDTNIGHWRQFGYGIASMYKSDLERVGGFDTDIKGWGKEDIDLLQKFIKSNITIFRSADVGMTHMYHSKDCDPRVDAGQYQMCVGTKASSYASTETLANIIYNTPDIYEASQRNDLMHVVPGDNVL